MKTLILDLIMIVAIVSMFILIDSSLLFLFVMSPNRTWEIWVSLMLKAFYSFVLSGFTAILVRQSRSWLHPRIIQNVKEGDKDEP